MQKKGKLVTLFVGLVAVVVLALPDRKFRHGPPKERGLEKAGAR